MVPLQTPSFGCFVVLCILHLGSLSAYRLFPSTLEEGNLMNAVESVREFREGEPHERWKGLHVSSRRVVKEASVFLPGGRELRAFVKYSVYRNSMTEFYVVGLASETLRKKWGEPVIGCSWMPNGSPLSEVSLVNGTHALVTADPNDQHGAEYISVIVRCTFPIEVGGKVGGKLYLQVPRHQENPEAHVFGAVDMLSVLNEASVDPNLYRLEQNPNTKDKRFRHKFAVCGAPLRTNVNATIIREWILWHKGALQDDVHFVIYVVENLEKDLVEILEKFEHEKLVTIVQAEDQSLYEGWYYNQVLFINDCIHRFRHVSKWALNMDYDEFLHVRSKNQNLTSLFDLHKDAGALYFNRVKYSIGHCLPQKSFGLWAIELRAFRGKSKCLDFDMHCHNDGRSKWAVNLKTALVGQVHSVYKFTSKVEKVTVDENVALFVHARQIVVQGRSRCSRDVYNITDHPEVIWDPTFTDQVAQLVEARQWQHIQATP